MRRFVALIALASLMGIAPASAGTSTVSVANYSFTPPSLVATQGGAVTFENLSASSHTATSDGGFFDTGTIMAGTSQVVTFVSAGTFPYHCQIHPSMHGSIGVPVILSGTGPVPKGTAITVHLGSQVDGGRVYDLRRKIGAGPWVSLATGLTGTTKRVVLKKKGRYSFQAAVTLSGATSGWSPSATIRVTPS